jgi:DNA-directed RNA polymerase specialized sigma24 family protein
MQAGEREIQALYRALLERDAASWDEAWECWSPRVAAWVRRHPQYRYTGEDVDYFINRAFEKLWRAVDSQKLGRFENPAQLAQYLKLCVHSVIVDALRSPAPEAVAAVASEDELKDLPAPELAVEEQVVGRAYRDSLWATVAEHARSEEERCLVDAILVRGMPPREVASRYRGLFGGVEDVYRIKRNLMDRLSRDQRLREFLG